MRRLKFRLYILAAAVLWSTAGAAIKRCGLDGWQIAGRAFETYSPKGPYPNGMKAPAGKISNLGLTPGLKLPF